MSLVRGALTAVVILVALVLQAGFFGFFSYAGVVPNLVLLVVVAAALTRGPELGATLGLLAGLALDLAPPADHVAGRWALALVLVGFLAGRVRQDVSKSTLVALGTVAGCSFVGTSVFALTGILLADPVMGASEALRVIALSVGYDVLLAPFVLPVVMRFFRQVRPAQVAY